MRRTNIEVTDPEKIDRIIRSCHCCRLGFQDGEDVYLVPLNFGYLREDETRIFYFHGAHEGRKIQLIQKNGRAGFELDTGFRLIEGQYACDYTAAYQSVMGNGKVTILTDPADKQRALQMIMAQSTGKVGWEFTQQQLDLACLFQLEVEEISCKEHL